MKKKMLACLLALVMVVALLPTAVLAAGTCSLSFSSAENVKPGDTVNITLTVTSENAFTYAAFIIQYDTDVLSFDPKTDYEFENTETSSVLNWDANDRAVTATLWTTDMDSPAEGINPVPAGQYSVTLKFHVADNAADGKYDITFVEGKSTVADFEDNVVGTLTLNNGSITVGSGSSSGDDDPPAPTAGYTVAMSSDKTSAAIGDTVELSLDVSHESETEFSAFYGSLSYDSSKFSYSGTADDSFSVTDDKNGALTITRTGDAVAISDAHELTLRFEAKAAGTADFALGSVKIDKRANAENNAPDATVSGSPITVTVVDTVVEAADYFNGYKLVKVTGTLAEGSTFFYGEDPMLKVSGGGCDANAYYFVVAEADYDEAKVSAKEGTSETLAKTADVNQTGLIDINDAQFVYNIYNGGPMPTKNITARLLLADVNGDGKVNILDCAAVIAAIQ